jgi:hypothetical protein
MAECLMRSLSAAAEREDHTYLGRALRSAVEKVPGEDLLSSAHIVEAFEEAARAAVKAGHSGLLVVVDELGKLLEYAALHPERSDIHVLQQLAEAACRSRDFPLILVTVLHQSIEHYSLRLGRRYQQEWSKVQQRFHEVPCALDSADSLRLVAQALNSSANPLVAGNHFIRSVAEQAVHWAPAGLEGEFPALCLDSYPLHPTVVAVLPALMKRLGQNERSLFSFLSADEPFSLPFFLREREFDPDNPDFVRLSDLFDYASAVLLSGHVSPAVAQVWAEVSEALASIDPERSQERDVLKSIGLLSLLGELPGLRASRDFLAYAIGDVRRTDLALQFLQDRRVITYRRWRDAYRVWEGSDIDMEERMAAAERAVPPLFSVSVSVARDICPPSRMVARRHSFRTGMLRSFEVRPCSASALREELSKPTQYDGKVLHVLAETVEELHSAHSCVEEYSNPDVVIAVALESDGLREAALEVQRLEWIRQNTPALAHDRVARRELSERCNEAQTVFRSEWSRLFTPPCQATSWFWKSDRIELRSLRELHRLLSDACDATYPFAPLVQNELINRRTLSSAAAKARRNLVEAILTASDRELLGLKGYPPERSIYESLLFRTGIHRRDNDGSWRLSPPDASDPGIQAAWAYLEAAVCDSGMSPKEVSVILEGLTMPPYGVADGFAPVLLTAFLLVNEATVALYESGSFVADLTAPVLERLMRRPDSFSVVGYQVKGDRQAVLERFAKGFGVQAQVLPVVRYLYRAISRLPQYTLSTASVSPWAAAVRSAITMARRPEKLLFEDLPAAVGCPALSADSRDPAGINEFFNRLNTAFSELAGCYDRLLNDISHRLSTLFQVPESSSGWRDVVSRRAAGLLEYATDPRHSTVLSRIADRNLEGHSYLESVAAGVAGAPPARWTRTQEEAFQRLWREFAAAVKDYERRGRIEDITGDGEEGWLLALDNSRGASIKRVIRIAPAERELVSKLAEELLARANGGEGERIVLAALAEAARRLSDTGAGGEEALSARRQGGEADEL